MLTMRYYSNMHNEYSCHLIVQETIMQETIAAEGIQAVLINQSVLMTVSGVKVLIILYVTTVVIRHQVVVCNPPCILLRKSPNINTVLKLRLHTNQWSLSTENYIFKGHGRKRFHPLI